MLKRLMILGGMLAMLLVVAAPAMAQTDKEYSGTGLLPEQPYNAPGEVDSLYTLTDEVTGVSYELYSGFVELEDFAGQRVYFEGLQQGPPTQGPIQVNVTYIEPVGTEGIETNAEVTGVISPNPDALIPGGEPTSHLITEDGTGDVYEISSYGQGPDLALYEGQLVTIYGIFQTLGNPLSSIQDLTEVPIAVTEVEVSSETPSDEPPAEEPSTEDQYQEDVGTTEKPAEADGTDSRGGIVSVLPDTGGFSPAAVGLVALLLLGGGGLLTYGFIRQR